MLRPFKIYPKEGDMFTLSLERFELKDNKFILYNNADQETKEGFLSFDNVAAIIPDNEGRSDLLQFLIYLKNKPEPATVFANAFNIEQEPSVIFLLQSKNQHNQVTSELEINEIYVALSEVVAIIPSDGLPRRF